MHLAPSISRTFAVVSVFLLLVEHTLAQVCDCQGAVGTLYDNTTTCDPAGRVKACTWMYGNRCCEDPQGTFPIVWVPHHSASMHGIENLPDGPTAAAISNRRTCLSDPTVVIFRNGCMSNGGEKTVTSVGWGICKDLPDLCARPQGPQRVEDTPPGRRSYCESTVSPDVVFIRERDGEAGIPFAETGLYKLNAIGGDVVDMQTMKVKDGKLDAFREYLARYGDGLSTSQVQAMRVLARDDQRQGKLARVMRRFLEEDGADTGRSVCDNSSSGLPF